jgi:adenine-specific DNA-methyltransferase
VETTENIFIEGDNLEVLKLLHKSYRGKIKAIYIDPPYNTGNDFIYKDDYRMPLESYLRRSGQKSDAGELLTSNPKSSGRFHSDWLSMMYPRLRIAKDLLRDDGVICVSIDDNEVHNLRQLMNEVFGEENFIAELTIVNNAKGRNDKKNIAPCHEYLMMYGKSEFESLGLPLTDE